MNHNRLRAGVMGLIDGIVTMVLVVAGGLDLKYAFITLVAGAVSMGIAEWASVSNQRDALLTDGIRVDTAIRREYNPWDAGVTSLLSFFLGGALCLLPLIPSGHHWDTFSFVVGLVVLWLAGGASAQWAEVNPTKGAVRLVAAAGLAILLTYSLGLLIGA